MSRFVRNAFQAINFMERGICGRRYRFVEKLGEKRWEAQVRRHCAAAYPPSEGLWPAQMGIPPGPDDCLETLLDPLCD